MRHVSSETIVKDEVMAEADRVDEMLYQDAIPRANKHSIAKHVSTDPAHFMRNFDSYFRIRQVLALERIAAALERSRP